MTRIWTETAGSFPAPSTLLAQEQSNVAFFPRLDGSTRGKKDLLFVAVEESSMHTEEIRPF